MQLRKWQLRKFFLGISLSLLFSANALAALSEETLDRIIVESGIEAQVNQFPEIIQSLARQAANENLQDTSDLERILSTLVTTEGMFQKIRSGLNANFNEGEAQVLLNWLNSSLGKRITRAEEQANTPQGIADMQRRAASLLLSEQRLVYAEQMVVLTQPNDLMMEVQDQMAIRTFQSVSRAMRPDDRPDTGPLRRELEESRAQRRANLQEFTKLAMVYTYKPFDFSEIESYINFLKKDETRKLYEVFNTTFRDEMLEGVERFAEALAAEILKNRSDAQET